ncbi:MAG: hypothetical protein DHS20C03_27030 [Minwuia thermotolerans]|nr:MAG: hypothetical protein DHS20C03_27030 [Minwuia thermotolerans]
MGISDITIEAVLVACKEFDELGRTEFLRKYGFGASRTYKLFRDGKYYDSKAIIGAAHGHLGLGYKALEAKEFSGGLQQTVRVIEQLGFEVEKDPVPTRNPDWSRDELILATEFYLQHAPRIPGQHSRALINLADEIRAAAAVLGLKGNEKFRNPNGVYMKLMELRKYDDAYQGIGLGHERLRDVELEVWTLPEGVLLLEARRVRKRIQAFLEEGGIVPRVERPLPKSAVLQGLIESEDPVDNHVAEVLIDWQDVKRQEGLSAYLGREPGQIKKYGAKHIVEQRVRSRASGFGEVAGFGETYENVVDKHPDRFPADVVEIAKKRLADFGLMEPTDDRQELERRTRELLSRPDLINEPPAGNPNPCKAIASGYAFIRDPRVVAFTQFRARGKCDLCMQDAPFKRADDTPYLETHHVLPLAEGGPDTVENCAAVCPNCHRALHSAGNRDALAEKLRAKVAADTSLTMLPSGSLDKEHASDAKANPDDLQ